MYIIRLGHIHILQFTLLDPSCCFSTFLFHCVPSIVLEITSCLGYPGWFQGCQVYVMEFGPGGGLLLESSHRGLKVVPSNLFQGLNQAIGITHMGIKDGFMHGFCPKPWNGDKFPTETKFNKLNLLSRPAMLLFSRGS